MSIVRSALYAVLCAYPLGILIGVLLSYLNIIA